MESRYLKQDFMKYQTEKVILNQFNSVSFI